MKHKLQENLQTLEEFHEYLLKMSPHLKFQLFDSNSEHARSLIFPDVPIVTCVVDCNGQEDHCVTVVDL